LNFDHFNGAGTGCKEENGTDEHVQTDSPADGLVEAEKTPLRNGGSQSNSKYKLLIIGESILLISHSFDAQTWNTEKVFRNSPKRKFTRPRLPLRRKASSPRKLIPMELPTAPKTQVRQKKIGRLDPGGAIFSLRS
jgi:hypothetical protein